jgi:hypothetical protein
MAAPGVSGGPLVSAGFAEDSQGSNTLGAPADTAEDLVIVEIVDGVANTTLVHLPATRCSKGGFRFDSYDFPPTRWPAACGVGSGSVYVRAGEFAESAICPDCEAKV